MRGTLNNWLARTAPIQIRNGGRGGRIRTGDLLVPNYTALVPARNPTSRFVPVKAHLRTGWCRPITSLLTALVSKGLAIAKAAEHSAMRRGEV